MITHGGPKEWARSNPFYPQFLFGITAFGLLGAAVATGEMRPPSALLFLGGGMVAWTFLEYMFHRFLFHVLENWAGEDHLRHHELPRDASKVAAPMVLSFPMFWAIFGTSWIVFGSFGAAASFGSGLCLGYMIYEWIHYCTHHRVPRTRLGKYYRRYHMIHHFKDTQNYFGVSSPFWDWVFRTKPVRDGAGETASARPASEL